MKVNRKHYQTIWTDKIYPKYFSIINQNKLPFFFEIKKIYNYTETINAISTMEVRGAPLIGVTGAFGMYLAVIEAIDKFNKTEKIDNFLINAAKKLSNARPTAVNLSSAVMKSLNLLLATRKIEEKKKISFTFANLLAKKEIKSSKLIGENGYKVIKNLFNKKNRCINILTHCNAGWLACIDFGTATAPIYKAHNEGLDIHVWVEETRPRNQGAKLTAWELFNEGIKHTIITDNAGGYLMQKGLVDIVITGSDRTTLSGDVCNKIGTYKTAVAAKENKIPFYAAVPLSSFDFGIKNGLEEIPIEVRDSNEIKFAEGLYKGKIIEILISNEHSSCYNPGFDITPAKLITGIITENDIIKPNQKEILKLIKINKKEVAE